MAGSDGRLDVLTIAAIFVVVFAVMWGGIRLWEGELFPEDRTSEAEDSLRAAAWDLLNDRRTDEGLERMPMDRFERGQAQETADIVSEEWPTEDGADAVVLDGTAKPNRKLLCTRLVVRVPNPRAEPGADAVSNDTLREETAGRIAAALVAADETGVLRRRPARFHAALGVDVHPETVYAVYRSCEQADI